MSAGGMLMKMRLFRLSFAACVMGVMFCGALTAAAEESDLKLSIAVYAYGRYMKPADNTIVVAQRPFPFMVQIENVSEKDIPVYEEKRTFDARRLEFEFTPASGQKIIISHKEAKELEDPVGFRLMSPEERIVASVLIHDDDWDNVPTLAGKGPLVFSVRAIYVGKKGRLYSPTYTVKMNAP